MRIPASTQANRRRHRGMPCISKCLVNQLPYHSLKNAIPPKIKLASDGPHAVASLQGSIFVNIKVRIQQLWRLAQVSVKDLELRKPKHTDDMAQSER
jgi:hypothetical protein